MCTLMDDSIFLSVESAHQEFSFDIYILYIYIYIYIYMCVSLTPFWFSPLVMYNYSNESFWECIKQNAYFISIIG